MTVQPDVDTSDEQEALARAREEGQAEAMADHAQKQAAELARITQEAVDAERTRMRTILNSSQARGRADLAKHLAFATDFDVETSLRLLSAAPTAAANPLGPFKRLTEMSG